MKRISILILLFLSGESLATPESPLYVSIKNNNVCLYTKSDRSKSFNDRVYFYMGEVIRNSEFKGTYEKIYNNAKVPTTENNCIIVDSSNFKNSVPYYLYMEADKAYSQRICVNNQSKPVTLTRVKNIYDCSQEEYDYSGQSFWEKLLNWLGFN